MIIEEMVCKVRGHSMKTILLSQLPLFMVKHFQSPRALACLIDITDPADNMMIEYCRRCKTWDIKQKNK